MLDLDIDTTNALHAALLKELREEILQLGTGDPEDAIRVVCIDKILEYITIKTPQ